MPDGVLCEVCQVHIPAESYETHLKSKKHTLQEETLSQRKNLEETGLFVQDVPRGVSAAELQLLFGRFGCISKIEIYGPKAYINYTDKRTREEAIKHQHVIHNQVLNVRRRVIMTQSPSLSQSNALKRSHPNTSKPDPRNLKPETCVESKVKIDPAAVLEALSDPAPITEQMKKLKQLLLPNRDHSKNVIQIICNDLAYALRSAFKVCELLPFGSMTTGLAFKDSDLDVYAQLEFDSSTHFIAEDQAKLLSKRCFNKAKGCLYTRNREFKNIVPIAHAKTPIIKFVHFTTQVSCDLSFKDANGYCNSRLLCHYLDMNERFFDLCLFIKYWARVHGLCASSKFSNFSLCMLALSFLFSLKDKEGNKVIPPVQELLKDVDPSSPHYIVSGWRCAFNAKPLKVCLPDIPEFSLLGLLKDFFQYIISLPFQSHVISLLTGELISREVFNKNPSNLPPVYESYLRYISLNPSDVLFKESHCAVIHDPFKLNHNLLSRISTANLEELISASKIAGKECAEAMNDNEEQTRVIHNLLHPNSSRFTAGKSRKPQKEKCIIPAHALKNSSFDNIKDLIVRIFEKLLLFKTSSLSDINSDDTKEKVRKTTGMKDVHGNQQSITLYCEGSKNVWCGRKKAKKAVNKLTPTLIHPLTFENELSISEFISQQDASVTDVKFKCEFSFVDGKLFFDISDNGSEKNGYNSFVAFLECHFAKWMSDFITNTDPIVNSS